MSKKRTQTEIDVEQFYALLNSPKPSLNRVEYWLAHFSDFDEYKQHTDLGGKWLVFCSANEVDNIWAKIKDAQDKHLLGQMSKVSTATGRGGNHNSEHVICVYTYDSSDIEDLTRVREGLKTIGINKVIPYKRDLETINGVYGTDNEFLLHI